MAETVKQHKWKPTTNTGAVYKCAGCRGVVFSTAHRGVPTVFPKDPCGGPEKGNDRG